MRPADPTFPDQALAEALLERGQGVLGSRVRFAFRVAKELEWRTAVTWNNVVIS
jgi:hypothetical protein